VRQTHDNLVSRAGINAPRKHIIKEWVDPVQGKNDHMLAGTSAHVKNLDMLLASASFITFLIHETVFLPGTANEIVATALGSSMCALIYVCGLMLASYRILKD
jgi:hypothetical protein